MLKLIVLTAATLLTSVTALPVPAVQAPEGARDRALRPYRQGFESLRAESFDEATKLFSDAVRIDPTFEMAFYMLGRVHLTQKRFTEAIGALREARRLYGLDAGRNFSSAQEAQRHRRETMAEIDEYIRQLQSGRQTPQTMEQIRQLNDRKRLLQDVVSRGNNMTLELAVPAYVSLSLGSAHFRAGQMAAAEAAYLDAIRADPKTGEAHNNLAVVYFETGRYVEADRALRAAEKVGFRVHPQLKSDIQSKIKTG